jgi:GNAT superfamily N-acetyltransferase
MQGPVQLLGVAMCDQLNITWCDDPAEADSVASFFAQHVDSDYISHGELQLGRATDPEHWSPDLARLIADEIRCAGENGAHSERRVVTASIGSRLAAMALVGFHRGFHSRYVVLEDLMVDKALRRNGIGDAVLKWIEKEVRTAGCERMFLESGIRNREAHGFFERHGFRPCSLVMMKSVGA